jgi:hypothetical protein
MLAVPSRNWGNFSFFFPANLSPDSLYPETSVEYTDADGTSYDVSCFVPNTTEVQRLQCPLPFVSPLAVDNVESCIQPCPVPAYTDEEYTFMWGFSNGIGAVGLLLNLFMAFTWAIADKRDLMKTPYQLKFCVFAGLLFGVVGTLPSFIFKYDLPCTCETEEWYFLLGLSSYSYRLFRTELQLEPV